MSRRISEVRMESTVGQTVVLRGWIHRLRKQKEKAFIILRDDRGDIIQAVSPSNLTENLTIESSVEITGRLERDDRAIEGGYEVKVNKIVVFNIAASDYPIGEYQSDEILLDYRHLALRTRKLINVGKIRGPLLKYSRGWFDRKDWIEVTPPLLVKGALKDGLIVHTGPKL